MNKILKYLNNYFYRFGERGTYEIKDNKIIVRGKYLEGQYIRIVGSLMNDTVLKVISVAENEITLEKAYNEIYEGTIYSLAVPIDLIELLPKIEEFEEKNKPSDLASESFGGYSYSKATNKNGEAITWKDAFWNDIKGYRKMNDSVMGVKFI